MKKMRKKLRNRMLLFAMVALTAGSCSKKDNLDQPVPVGLGGDTVAKGPIDIWLFDSLTSPYNIAVKYHWDPFELQLDRTLVPPQEDKIIPAMSALRRVWINPYNDETGSELFVKRYSPKQFVLVGSVQYDFGSVILGQAEGGNNIVFFDLNQHFDQNSQSSLQRMIHTSHHEFGHILNQNVTYPTEFKTVNTRLNLPNYTSTWFNISEKDALDQGYITAYARAADGEDFVEMVANMLVLGRSRYNELVSSTNSTAQSAIRQKEQIVVDYYKNVWKIDFYSLQNRVQAALILLAPLQPIAEAYGFGKSYQVVTVNPDTPALVPQSASFLALFEKSADSVAAIPSVGLTLDSLALVPDDASNTTLRMYIEQDGNTFLADFGFAETVNGDLHSYDSTSANGNAELIRSAVSPLLDYFENNQFKVSWYADPTVTLFPRIRFAPVASPSKFFTGLAFP